MAAAHPTRDVANISLPFRLRRRVAWYTRQQAPS